MISVFICDKVSGKVPCDSDSPVALLHLCHMSADEPSVELASVVTSSERISYMPHELLLSIVDIALESIKHGDSTSARRLSCVSHAFRTFTLPRLYEILVISIPKGSEDDNGRSAISPVIGHDGRKHKHPHLALLSWLILEPTAEPRKYIKQIALSQLGSISVTDFVPISETDPSRRWIIDRLIVRKRYHFGDKLYKAGIRAEEVHVIEDEYTQSLEERFPLSSMGLASGRFHWFKPWTRGHFRCWVGGNTSIEEGLRQDDMQQQIGDPSMEWKHRVLVGLRHRLLNPWRGGLEGVVTEASRCGLFFMIEIHGNLEISSPEGLVDDIKSILLVRNEQTVVLVHAPGDHAAIDQVATIIAAARSALPQKLCSRLRVSHVIWDRELLDRNPIHAYVSLVRRGIDPWDDGRVPDALLA